MKLIPLSKYRTDKWEILEDYRDVILIISIIIIFLGCCYGEVHMQELVKEAAAKQNNSRNE